MTLSAGTGPGADRARSSFATRAGHTRARCVVIGEGTLPLRCADALRSRGFEVSGVVARRSEAGAWAAERGVPLIDPDTDLAAALAPLHMDYLFSVVNYTILREDVLSLPGVAAINYHDAPLPRYAGVHATTWALMAGEASHAVTWHEIHAGIDTGRILVQHVVPVSGDDTALTLNLKCYESALAAFDELLDGLQAGTLAPREQDASQRSYFGRWARPRAGGIIAWEQPASVISAFVRALDFGASPNALAVPKLVAGGVAYACDKVQVLDEPATAVPGTIVRHEGAAIVVSATDRCVRVPMLRTMRGDVVAPQKVRALAPGELLATVAGTDAWAIEALHRRVARHEPFWVERLLDATAPAMARVADAAAPAAYLEARLAIPLELGEAEIIAALGTYLLRTGAGDAFDLAAAVELPDDAVTSLLFEDEVPVSITFDLDTPFADAAHEVDRDLAEDRTFAPFARDLRLRHASLRALPHEALPVAVLHDSVDARASRPLTLFYVEGAGRARLVADQRYFTQAALTRMARRLTALMQAASRRPDMLVGQLPITDAEEREVILGQFGRSTEHIEYALVHERFALQAQQQPDAIAVEIGGRTLTYAQLDERATQLARALRAHGVGPEARVAILLERSLELMIALIAVQKAGGAYVPLDHEQPADRCAAMLTDAAPRVVLTQRSLESIAALAEGADVYVLDRDWKNVVADATGADVPLPVLTGSELAYVIYTSGSTGVPKGVMISYRALAHYIQWMSAHWPLTAADAVLQKAPVSFDASVWELYLPLATGARLVLAAPGRHRDFGYVADLIQQARITVVQFVPSVLAAMLDIPDLPRAFANVRLVFCGGEALPVEIASRLLERLPGVPAFNLYGPTEVTVYATCHPVQRDEHGAGAVPIGRPIADTRVYLLDPRDQPVPIGVAGELCLAGVQVARGYLNRPELNVTRFAEDPFEDHEDGARMYRTGDLARWRDDGVLEYLGRMDNQVKIRGFRVELGEIESVLAQHPDVREAAVVAFGRAAQARLVAYVVARAPAVADAEALRDWVRARLPDFMVPSAVMSMDALPLSRNGKLDRKALPEPLTLISDAGPYIAPRTPVEQVLAGMWAQLLGVPRAGATDDFFALGGQSLTAAQLLLRIRATFKIDLSMRTLFTSPVLADFAAALVAQERAPGQVEKIARLVQRLEGMSTQELKLAVAAGGAGRTEGAGNTPVTR